MWSNSSLARARPRRPVALTNVHWPLSRSQTARLTAAGMCRGLGLERRGLGRGRVVAANLRRSSSRMSRIEGAIEDLGEVPRGHLVPEQRLGVAQLVVRALPDRELQRVALG